MSLLLQLGYKIRLIDYFLVEGKKRQKRQKEIWKCLINSLAVNVLRYVIELTSKKLIHIIW